MPPFELFFFDLKIPGAEISTQAYAETLGDGAEKSIGYLENATEKIGGYIDLIVSFAPIFGEDSHFDSYFFRWVGSTTNQFTFLHFPGVFELFFLFPKCFPGTKVVSL